MYRAASISEDNLEEYHGRAGNQVSTAAMSTELYRAEVSLPSAMAIPKFRTPAGRSDKEI